MVAGKNRKKPPPELRGGNEGACKGDRSKRRNLRGENDGTCEGDRVLHRSLQGRKGEGTKKKRTIGACKGEREKRRRPATKKHRTTGEDEIALQWGTDREQQRE